MSSADNALDDKFLRLTVKEQTVITAKDMARKSLSTAKTFGVLSAIFVSTECITESIRGKDDAYNGVISGCITGAILSRSGTFHFTIALTVFVAGLQAMGLGRSPFLIDHHLWRWVGNDSGVFVSIFTSDGLQVSKH